MFICRQNKTSIWSLKKEIWFQGPILPDQVLHNSICSTALDSSKVVFVRYGDDKDEIAILDIRNGVWEMVDKLVSAELYWVKCATFTRKDYSQIILILQADLNPEQTLWRHYDMTHRKWSQIGTECEFCRISNARGNLFSVLNHILFFYKLEDGWRDSQDGFSSAYKISENGNMTDLKIGYPFAELKVSANQGFSYLQIAPFYTRTYKNVSITIY